MTLLNTSFPTDYTAAFPATDTSQYWNSDFATIGPYTDSTWGIDNVPNWGIGDWGIDFGGGGGTTGGNTDFWNQGLGELGGKLFDFGIAGATAGMGINYMNQAQQAQQVQAERAAQAIRKKNTWDVGVHTLANLKELESQRDAEKWKRANLGDPNVLWDQERTMLRNAAVAGLNPQDAAYYAFIT